MTWVKSGENLYTHDQAPFIIENLNGSWGIRDTRDKTSFIPFSDIFNNPVFPIDLSNADVIVKTLNAIGAITGDSLSIINASLSKHFRGEANNTPGTPAFSFQGDINSGFYRISEDRIGFSANGIRQGEFGVGYGGFTGNIIQVLSVVKSDTFTTNNTTYTDVPNLSISITPKYNNSKILLLIDIGGFSPAVGGTSNMRLLRDATEIYSGDGVNGVLNQVHDGGSSTGEHYYGAFHHGSSFLDSPNTLSAIIYKIQVKSNGAFFTVLNRSVFDSSNYNGRTASSITVLEVQQ